MFILQETPIDPVKAKNMCRNPANGAIVVFEGVVRADKHEGSVVSELLYIADTPVCNLEGEKIIKAALSQFAITEAVCIQRIGQLKITETAVWIGVWAPHRDEAFKGCRYIIEEIKKRLLIWKKNSMPTEVLRGSTARQPLITLIWIKKRTSYCPTMLTFQLGGPCHSLIECATPDELIQIVQKLRKDDTPFLFNRRWI